MRRYEANEFSRRYDLRLLPESREMLLIARDQIVRSGSVRTFQECVVIGVECHFKAPGWNQDVTVLLDKLQHLLLKTLANAQLRAAEHDAVFLEDRKRHVEESRFGDRQEENSAGQPCRINGSGNQDVCVNYQPEGKHSPLRLLGPGSLDDLIDSARGKCARSVALRLFTDDS